MKRRDGDRGRRPLTGRQDTTSIVTGHNTPTTATVRLRAERKGDLDGRVYVIVLIVNDANGNLGKSVCTVLVPHSQSKAAIASVMAQASAAQSHTAAFVAAILGNDFSTLPAPYVKVGDGG